MIKILDGQYVFDGAGVRIFRLLSHDTIDLADPFLLLDHFGSDNPKDYKKGFPWHPHRGIETVTYMLKGDVEHADNIGNKGVIGPGDIQWMSAGSGIIHQEMPQGTDGMYGFQLWVNMPKKDKMTRPRYRGIIRDQIPIIQKDGVEIRLVAGSYDGKKGPVADLIIDVEYLDISMDKDKDFSHPINPEYTTFCYVIEGKGKFQGTDLVKDKLILLKDVSLLTVKSYGHLRFLLVSGKPLKESIAWGGPIVMNTEEELEEAFDELKHGTFIKP